MSENLEKDCKQDFQSLLADNRRLLAQLAELEAQAKSFAEEARAWRHEVLEWENQWNRYFRLPETVEEDEEGVSQR
jgi:cell division septum initiation protein DivIVA